ncbi:complement C1q tumor necrosis factor-related protein 3-like isoform X2 [Saccostrea echinata]|uniref:complement C1q tumor necrosis factor-related protein 3-like isoform X2 n=1 Tax=Saccostrea echinata TaxID=191078 RepID=UPI002A81EA28|nr:complement C1q tumor necrosis factor-related protein 3-like isoform X2 [Saccostrea echinata]
MINEKQDKNFTQRLNEIVNVLMKYDKQGKNVTQRLNEIHNILTANEEYDKNLTLQLTDSMNNLQDIKVQMRYTSLSLMDVHSKTDSLNTTLTRNFDDQIRDVYGRITNMTKKVAFTVGVTSSSSSWNSGTLVFDRIVYNIGGGYDSSTGIFTAPVNGHFVFFVNVQNDNRSEIYTYLVLNGSTKVTTLANNSYQAGPNLAVLRLQKGDRVWVKHWSGIGYFTNSDAPVTTFSGFLI